MNDQRLLYAVLLLLQSCRSRNSHAALTDTHRYSFIDTNTHIKLQPYSF